MTMKLPEVISRYFAADKQRSAAASADYFTPDAIVIDERNKYVGRDAIREWMAHASTRYTYTVEPFALSLKDGRSVVTSHLVGNFPGSPVDLRYLFLLDGDLISELEIVPA